MARPVTVNIPHCLGKDEARRRIAAGFGGLSHQMTGAVGGALALSQEWQGDTLSFAGGGFGQKVTGRIEVLDDAVQIQLDLPEILAAIAERIAGRLKTEAQRLLGDRTVDGA